MRALVDAIRAQGTVLPGGILKVDGLINHQLLPQLTREMGETFARSFGPLKPTKVVTIEVSGIAPALATSLVLGVPMVYARKKRPVTMQGPVYTAQSVSRTKGGVVELFVSHEYLSSDDRVVVIDDFLASGGTLLALAGMIRESGAQLLGMGCVVEKAFEHGRANLASLGVPVRTLANIVRMDEGGTLVVEAGH